MPRLKGFTTASKFVFMLAVAFALSAMWLMPSTAYAQCPQPGFRPTHEGYDFGYIQVSADFNMDGKLDIAGSDKTGTQVFVSLGDGMGNFSAPTYTLAGSGIPYVRLGDFNGDGKPDLIAPRSANPSNALVVLLGNGTGGFGFPVTTEIFGFAPFVDVADFNADGKSDIILTTGGSESPLHYQTRLSDGTGHFAVNIDYSVNVQGLPSFGDFNGDGKVDVLFKTSGLNPNKILFYINNGAGLLNAMPSADLTGLPGGSFWLHTADLNNDGKTDFAYLLLNGNTLSVFMNNGGVSFTKTDYAVLSPASMISSGDFNGDGKLDLITGQEQNLNGEYKSNFRVSVLSGNGMGGFTRSDYRGPLLESSVVGDFNADGSTDLINVQNNANINNSLLVRLWTKTCNAPLNTKGINDYDGDGRTDIAVFRPSNGTWYTSLDQNANYGAKQWGTNGDIPVPGDYDYDGKTDVAVFRPSNGYWFILNSSNGAITAQPFGINSDKPMQADYDGDNKTDIAVFRPSEGGWYILRSSDGAVSGAFFGTSEDKPVAADYDGDEKADIAVFRPSIGYWFILSSIDNSFRSVSWGVGTDKPVPGDYDGDGKADVAIFRPEQNVWYFQRSYNGAFFTLAFYSYEPGNQPVPGDYDGDGVMDGAFRRPTQSQWLMDGSARPFAIFFNIRTYGVSGDIPVSTPYRVE